jgi:hypothetical protein
MDIVLFALGILGYILVNHLIIKIHRALNIALGWPKFKGFSRNVLGYSLWLAFIVIEIPFCFFFPIWLNSAIPVFEDTENVRMALILFGCAVLPIVMWVNYKKQQTAGYSNYGL